MEGAHRTTSFVVGVATLACVACGGVLQPGLPNVPALGGASTVDARPQAVVSNGDEACAGEGSVLRGKLPPCPNIEKTRADLGFASAAPKPAMPLVVPWRRDGAKKWPCLESAEPALAMSPQPIEVLPISCSFAR